MPKSATNKNVFKNFFLPMIVLVAICVVIGSAMAAVNMITAPKIAETHAKKEQEALSVVVPNNQGFDQVELDKAYDSVVALYADKGSNALAVMLSVKGYDSSNPMSVAVGFDEDGKITKCSVIACTGETKGIGSKVSDESFLSRFYGKNDVSGVDTISGATISSSAFKKAVEEAISAVNNYRAAEVTK